MVFGSLAAYSRFGYFPDIDLAAVGMPDEKLYKAVGTVVTKLITGFEVDLVDLENCKSPLRKVIESERVEI